VRSPRTFVDTNVVGTLALLEAIRDVELERFVFVSSSTVYGRQHACPFREDFPLGVPQSPYGVTKQAGETLCQTYHDLHGLRFSIVRPFSVYGSRIRPDLAIRSFAESLRAGRPLVLFDNGRLQRDFTHVSDIVRGIFAAMTLPAAEGEAFNLGNDRPVEVRLMVEELARLMRCRPQIHSEPAPKADLATTWADLSKSRRTLGYEPQCPLVEGLADFVSWFQQGGAT
jgi:UDP-glucuronate 4-epimerase